MHRSRHARQRMKQPRRALCAKLTIYRVPDRIHIRDEVIPAVTIGPMKRVMSMIAEVEDDYFVTIAKRPPERKVAVNREPVAMTQDQARRADEAVLADVDDRAVVHLHVEYVASAGNMMYRDSFVHLAALTASLPDRCRSPNIHRLVRRLAPLRRASPRGPRASASARAILPSPAIGSAA